MDAIQKNKNIEPPICERCGSEMVNSVFSKHDYYYCNNKECSEKRAKEDILKQKEKERKEREQFLKELPGKVDAKPSWYLWEIGISPKYYNESLETFKNGGKIVNACKEYLKNPNGNLLLMGDCGSGKTHIACSICRELVKKGNKNVKFKSVPGLLLELRSVFNEYIQVKQKPI